MADSDKVLVHHDNPRNPGMFDIADQSVGTGIVEAPACGDVMRLQIEVGDSGIIRDACFKAYGCDFAISCCSLVTEWVKGKTLEEGLAIKNVEIAAALALPSVAAHCATLAREAIKAAVADYRVRHPADDENPFASVYDPLVP